MRVVVAALQVAGAVLALAAGAAGARACARAPLCLCRRDHLACSDVPFHRFPNTEAGVRHVSVSGARLGTLGETALDGRALRTLVLFASRLHHIEPGALSSMASTLASLDLGHNEFTEVPLESLRELKVLNWLNLQNNYISDLEPHMDWGFLADCLSSLSLSNNHLYALSEGALSQLRHLVQLDLDGNRLHVVEERSLPASLALLRLSDNLLQQLPCAALSHLSRLRHLHIRNNLLQPTYNRSCPTHRINIDYLDISHNELDDMFELELQQRLQLKQLLLDFNEFSSVPSFVVECVRLEKLSLAYNRVSHVSEGVVHALRRHLERLEVDHNELTTLPADMAELLRLRHLSASYNSLLQVSVLPRNLHSLSLAGNYLNEMPAALHHLEPDTLAYLDLGYNQIASLSGETFGAWSGALTTLILKGNRLSVVGADTFPVGLALRELVLSYNEVLQVSVGALGNLTALQVLELSSTMFTGEFPLHTPTLSLSWLTLDNNNIHYVTSEHLLNFPSLEYLNLDFNKIVEFPSEVYVTNSSCRLKELRVSYNYINKINSEYLTSLRDLQSVDLSYNHMQNISDSMFLDLPNLVYLSLAGNVIEFISQRAFSLLPRLEVLEMQNNNLFEFSTEYFEKVSNSESTFSVNVSYNKISSLSGGGEAILINILDLSHNFLESLSRAFFDRVAPSLRHLVLSYNHLTHIDNLSLSALSSIEVLLLNFNKIASVRRRAFGGVSPLQVLELAHNRLTTLAPQQFRALRRLRHLRLDHNLLRALPRDAFADTLLEYLDLSHNLLVMFPASALAQVGFTLRRLELAHNRLEYLDAVMFHSTTFLHELGLAHNALTVLSDNTFAGLARLRALDLSYNTIKTNFKELFHNVPRLRRLSLAGAGLRAVPPLPLANLTELDLSSNHIAAYRELDVRRLSSLRVLVLAHNRLTSLQPALWAALPRLTALDVSHNPLVRLTSSSLEGLSRMLRLRMDHLHHLDALDARSFCSLPSVRSLTMDTMSFTGRTQVSLAEVTRCTPGLERLEVVVRESTLDRQLAGLRAAKLRVLHVRGAALRQVSAQALTGLSEARVLSLRMSGTAVSALPPALLVPLARVPHLGLELTGNQLEALDHTTLYPNLTGWNRLATKLLSDGLVVSERRLRCGCGVRWVSAWLRRWTAEVGGWSAAARAQAGRSACGAGGAALLALDADEAACHASALSSRAARLPGPVLAPLLWLLLLYALS